MWIIYSLIFALWNGVSLPLSKHVLKSIKPILFIFLTDVLLLILELLFFIFTGFPHINLNFVILAGSAAILDFIAFFLSISAIKIAEISLIAPLASFSPIFTLILATFALKETPSVVKLLGVLMIVLGTYSLNISEVKKGIHKPFKKLFSEKGVLAYLTAFFIWSITPILQKPAIFQTSPQKPLFVSFFEYIIMTLLLLPFVFKSFKRVKKINVANYLLLFLLSGGGFISQLAAYSAFTIAPVGYVSAVMRNSILFNIVIAGFFFKEKKIKERLFGAIIMIIGTLILAV